MGLLQTIGLRKKDVEAQLSPPIMQQTYGAGVYTFGGLYNTNGIPFIDRNLALQVPAVSRCRNLICGVIASIDLELIQKSTGYKSAVHEDLAGGWVLLSNYMSPCWSK